MLWDIRWEIKTLDQATAGIAWKTSCRYAMDQMVARITFGRLAVGKADKINPLFITMDLLSPALMLGFKLQLQSRMEKF
jgi:hypothetical protein